MIVACVNVGDAYDDKYVYNLRDAVQRSLSLPYEFVCLADHNIPGVTVIRINDDRTPGWWAKLHLFRDDIIPVGDRVLYLDLDTLIPGKLDDIAQCDGKFMMLEDFYHPDDLASGVMLFESGGNEAIFTDWLSFGAPKLRKGDQSWISMHRPLAGRLQEVFPDRIKSFKASAAPQDCDILCFHGRPRPHECDGWVADLWNNRRLASQGDNHVS